MHTVLSRLTIAVAIAVGSPASAGSPAPAARQSAAPAPVERCEHGVKKSLCTRCNPKLAAVFKAKGDWCPEHGRPESQCVKCHPELAKEGVK
jgi:hypothetical protein